MEVMMKKVEDISIKKEMKAKELVDSMLNSGGFTAKKIGLGVEILTRMIKDKDCFKFLSFPADIISTGTRGVIKDLIKNKLVDAVITTCGTLDHDLARVWKPYYHGSFQMDDRELHQKGIFRLGNILIPKDNYGTILEEKMQEGLKQIFVNDKKEFSTKEIIWEFGKLLEKEKNKEDSILYWAYKNQIPIYVPGITDGAFGTQLWMFWQTHRDFKINLFEDEQELSDVMFTAKKTGALIIGGGISKHHTIWWNQFKGGLSYTVYITTAHEFDGSLSGAQVREAISWGKVSEQADYIDIICDATIALPLIYAALVDNL